LRLFGTDGVRGVANRDLTPDLALALGRAAALALSDGGRPQVVVARDTRLSGPMLESALAAGLMSAGAEVVLAGVLPTAGVAYLTRRQGFTAGVMISASHNPVEDNGIKFFAADGYKLPDAVEDRIEAAMREAGPRLTGAAVGDQCSEAGLRDDYVRHLEALGRRYSGGVVLDAAHGAATAVLPQAFVPAARRVAVISAEPDGARINVACGSTAPDHLQSTYSALGGTLGFAFDGDADRAIAVDEDGEICDGDTILALLALWLKGRGELEPSRVALTVMSNGGVRDFLGEQGIESVVTRVGDRYVVEAMRQQDIVLGGEQSGHIVCSLSGTTGDGLATGILALAALEETGMRLADLRRRIPRYPQRLRSVRVQDRAGALEAPRYVETLAAAEAELGTLGRVLVRPSGTEPVVRVMVEARREELADRWLGRLCEALQA